MPDFETRPLPAEPDARAPDGADVRILLRLAGGSIAHFALGPGRVSRAVTHRTVEEIWYVLGGRGEMWRRQGDRESVVALEPGVCLTIPLGTHFQFRSLGPGAARRRRRHDAALARARRGRARSRATGRPTEPAG